MKHFFIIVFAVLLLAIIFSIKYKEEFVTDLCDMHKSCSSCASASGCSWCPGNKTCISNNTLKSTDKTCNQMNTIHSDMACNASELSEHDTNNVLYDFTLYKNQITDKIPPPAIYTTEEQQYSPETVMASNKELRDDLHHFRKELPDIISSSMENQIGPMVKGILANNYYIQQ